MGVQSPGQTHPSQRCLGHLSPPAVPVPLGQVTLNPLGCSPGVGDPSRGLSTVGSAWEGPQSFPWQNGCDPQHQRVLRTGTLPPQRRLRGHGDVSAPGRARGVPVPPTWGSAHRWSHPLRAPLGE